MENIIKSLLDSQRAMFKKDMDEALQSRSPVDRKREAIALVNEETRAQRKTLLMAQGLTEGEAIEALQESANPIIYPQNSRRPPLKAAEIGYFNGDKLSLRWWLDRV